MSHSSSSNSNPNSATCLAGFQKKIPTSFWRAISDVSSSGALESGKGRVPANFHPIHVSVDRTDEVDLAHIRMTGNHFGRFGFSLGLGGRVSDSLGGLQQDPQLCDGLAIDRVRQLEQRSGSHYSRHDDDTEEGAAPPSRTIN